MHIHFALQSDLVVPAKRTVLSVEPCAVGVLTVVEIRGRPVVPEHHLFGKDNHVLTDGIPSDDLGPVSLKLLAGKLAFKMV
jgi:hypothetical protein